MSHRQAAASERRRRVVLVLAELLVTLSALVLLYLGWNLVIDDALAARKQTRAATDLEAAWDAAPEPSVQRVPVAQPAPGEPFAVIRVPRFGADWRRQVVEGTTAADLDGGVGHYRGTALPGEVGNFAVAGHRLTHGSAFTHIDALRVGDVVGIRTSSTWFVYRVAASEIVAPGRTDVIAPVAGRPGVAPERAVMTLTSCHPLYGSSERFVVHADLVAEVPATAGVPQDLRAEVG